MKIRAVKVEPGRGSQASVEFTLRVELDGPAAGCAVTGRVTGPSAKGMTTVEVAYPLVPAGTSDNEVSLRCVIPEPALWTPATPFVYAWSVEVTVSGKETASRVGAVAFPAPE